MADDTPKDPMQESSNAMMKALQAVFVTKEVFLESFKKAMDIILKREKALNEALSSGMSNLRTLFEDLKTQILGDVEAAKANMVARVDAALADQASGMNFIRDKVRDLKNIKGDPGDPGTPGKDGTEITPVEVRDKLETLEGDDRLDISAVKGWEKLQAQINDANAKGKPVNLVPGGPRGMFIYIGGVKKGIISNMNLVPGTNMAIAFSMVNGQPTLTFNASGGGSGSTVETPAGTVDGSNATFTPTSRPKWVVADGTTYYEGAGYTWDGTHVVMDIPPSGFIRDIY